MKKHFALRFIQLAWVAEVLAVLVYTMLIIPFLSAERIGLWISMLPHILGIIASQGAAAGVGPLAADYIKTRRNHERRDSNVPA
jgi:hypothetical protein